MVHSGANHPLRYLLLNHLATLDFYYWNITKSRKAIHESSIHGSIHYRSINYRTNKDLTELIIEITKD